MRQSQITHTKMSLRKFPIQPAYKSVQMVPSSSLASIGIGKEVTSLGTDSWTSSECIVYTARAARSTLSPGPSRREQNYPGGSNRVYDVDAQFAWTDCARAVASRPRRYIVYNPSFRPGPPSLRIRYLLSTGISRLNSRRAQRAVRKALQALILVVKGRGNQLPESQGSMVATRAARES